MQVSRISSAISEQTQKIGRKILSEKPDGQQLSKGMRKLNGLIEGVSYNPARPAYYMLMGGFVLLPRLLQAREPDEFREILTRDTITILTILFAMKGLKSGMCSAAQKKAGFSLVSDTVAKDASKGKRLLGYLNPDGGISALSSAEIATRYSNIKTQDQLVNMMTVVDKEGGSVAKMFDVEHQEGFLSKITKKIPFLSGKKEKETPLFDAAKKMFGEDFGTKSNQELIEAVRNITPDNAKALEGLEDVVGSTALCKTADEIEATAKTAAKKGVLNDKNNPLTYYARNIAANFETLSLALTAGFLGFGLPRLNEVMTMKKHLDKPTTNPERVSNPVGGCSNGQIFSTIKSKDVKTFQSFV